MRHSTKQTNQKLYKKLSPDDESRLYNVPEQPAVTYPPVVVPDESRRKCPSVEQQFGIQSTSTASLFARAKSGFGIRRVTTRRRIQVGLDFGTSSTKVMYSELGGGNDQTRLLDFGHGLRTYPTFCLPSTATFDKSGNLYFGQHAIEKLESLGLAAGMSRLKMLIAGRVDRKYLDHEWYDRFQEHVAMACGNLSYTPDAIAATYLAGVMRRVRQQLAAEFKSTDLDIVFNTCVPVDQSERTPVVQAFERVIATAGIIEKAEGSDNTPRAWLDKAASVIDNVEYDVSSDDQRVFIMPEAVATAAGYVTSIRSKPGIHAIVDIGAGTTDVSIFLLARRKASGIAVDWYAASSIPMGAGRIEDRVANKLAESQKVVDPSDIISALGGDSKLAKNCRKIIDDELERMRNGTNHAWSQAYGHNAIESAWRSGVTIFITGGGAQISGAKRIFSKSWYSNWGPYACDLMPTPDKFDNANKIPFNRLSVAFGLARPTPEHGQQTMPSKAPNHTPPRLPVRDWKQHGDQLLPRWGWT
jgi:hypothetical protein